MKHQIHTMKEQTGEPVSDLGMVFLAMYNLLYEKMEQEPGKGIVACKGLPNERKVGWKKLMRLAHELEDYFMIKKLNGCGDVCQVCNNWGSVSRVSPHLGYCQLKAKSKHAFDTCNSYKREVNPDV